ncbi:MAG: ABC transporter substrate binding protein [Gammaproteobacteria bacterium]
MGPASAEPVSLAVIIPEMSAPYGEIFSEIVKGIERRAGGRVTRVTLKPDTELYALQNRLQEQPIDAIIALGWRGVEAAEKLDGGWPVIAGAAILNPATLHPGVSGITLRTDPDVALSRLEAFVPEIQRVHRVYLEGNYSCLAEQAREAAGLLDLKLFDYPVSIPTMSARMQAYRELLAKGLDQHDAIWLCDDVFDAEGEVILEFLLEFAWKNRLVLFSENPAHAKRGALFAFLPDYARLGERLADMALERLQQPEKSTAVVPLSDVSLLINVRTAEHLSISVARRSRHGHLTMLPNGLVLD